MEFWIGLVIVCLVGIIVERLLPKPTNRVVAYILLGTVWFISAFRYMIGWDYESYMKMFYYVNFDQFYPEVSFIILATYFRDSGFDYQVIFLFYSTLTFLFLLKGIKFYFSDSRLIILAMTFYIIMPFLYWYSLSAIRQGLAVAIFFWASKYIISRNLYKYIMAILFATFWHYSAIWLILFYWIANIKVEKKYYFILIFAGIIVGKFELMSYAMDFMLNFFNVYTSYLEAEKAFSGGLTAVFLTALYLVILLTNNSKTKVEEVIFNMYTICILIIWIFSFSAPLLRLRSYFEIFTIVYFSKIIYSVNLKYKYVCFCIFIIPFIVMFLANIYVVPTADKGILHPYFSANNINYSFNFNLFQ